MLLNLLPRGGGISSIKICKLENVDLSADLYKHFKSLGIKMPSYDYLVRNYCLYKLERDCKCCIYGTSNLTDSVKAAIVFSHTSFKVYNLNATPNGCIIDNYLLAEIHDLPYWNLYLELN